jgi:hypothetical protein
VILNEYMKGLEDGEEDILFLKGIFQGCLPEKHLEKVISSFVNEWGRCRCIK